MGRLNAGAARVGVVCLVASACEGDVALFPSRLPALPELVDAGPVGGEPLDASQSPGDVPSKTPAAPVDAAAPVPRVLVPDADVDAGAPATSADASPAPAPSRPVVAAGPPAELPRLGVEGGDPRLGVCQAGVIVGVRTTANPSEEIFGQRLTFLEPICGKVVHRAPEPATQGAGSISVTRDDASVAWAVTEGFLGVPNTVVPDPRLVWVLQPATICPESAPVVVGLSGQYDPVAPDVPDTAAIRSLLVECAPLVLAPNGVDVIASASGHQLIAHAESFAATGADTYRSTCEDGRVTTQIKVHAGFWLDGFVLGCSSLRLE